MLACGMLANRGRRDLRQPSLSWRCAAGFDWRGVNGLAGRRTVKKPGSSPGFFVAATLNADHRAGRMSPVVKPNGGARSRLPLTTDGLMWKILGDLTIEDDA